MTPEAIRSLHAYNRWANARVLDAVVALSPEAFARDLGSSHRSVRDTLGHILGAEWIWLMRCNGTSPGGLPEGPWPTLEALRGRWGEVELELEGFVAGLSPETLERTIRYTNTRGESFEQPLWQILLHVVNHSTYHRGQVTTMLRQLGAVPAATDLAVFYRGR